MISTFSFPGHLKTVRRQEQHTLYSNCVSVSGVGWMGKVVVEGSETLWLLGLKHKQRKNWMVGCVCFNASGFPVMGIMIDVSPIPFAICGLSGSLGDGSAAEIHLQVQSLISATDTTCCRLEG